MSEFRIDQIKSQDATRGPDVAGITTFTGTSGIVMPSGNTAYRGGRGRGVFMGGRTTPSPNVVDTIDYITIATTGNATDFGNLIENSRYGAGCSSSVRGLYSGGNAPSSVNTIQYMTISSTGNTFDFGDMLTGKSYHGSTSDGVRGIFAGTWLFKSTEGDKIEYVTIASKGNATDFGGVLTSKRQVDNGMSDGIRGVFGAGEDTSPAPANINRIDYINIQSTGVDAQDFGDLPYRAWGVGSCSNKTRGLFAGGMPGIRNDITYITIKAKGNSVDFGNLSAGKGYVPGVSSPIRGVFGGGREPGIVNTIDYVEFATLGNATDFGDLTVARGNSVGVSDAHGGLG